MRLFGRKKEENCDYAFVDGCSGLRRKFLCTLKKGHRGLHKCRLEHPIPMHEPKIKNEFRVVKGDRT